MKDQIKEVKTVDDELPKHGVGIRHLQMSALAAVLVALLYARSSMAVAVLAMTDQRHAQQIDIYPWDKKTQGLILSSFFWGYSTMQIPSGLLAKRFGGKPMLLMALLVNTVLCLALPTLARLGGWPFVCAARLLTGASQACLFPSCQTLFGRWLPSHERTTLSGLAFGASSIGIIVSMPAAGLLAETVFGWPAIFYSSAGILLAVALAWWWLAASSPAQHRWIEDDELAYIVQGMTQSGPKNTLRTPWLEIFKCKGFWAIGIAHLGSTICYMLFLVDLPTYLEKGLNISLKDSSLLSALPYVGQMVGTVVSTRACDFLVNNKYLSLLNSRRLFNGIAFVGSGLCLIALTFIDERHKSGAVALLIISLTLYSFASAGWVINHIDLSPNYAGVMFALTNCVANAGSVVTPIGISLILRNDPTDVSRWRVVFAVMSAILAAGTLLYTVLCEVTKRPWDEPGYMDRLDADPEQMKPALPHKKMEKSDTADKNEKFS